MKLAAELVSAANFVYFVSSKISSREKDCLNFCLAALQLVSFQSLRLIRVLYISIVRKPS